MYKVLIVDDEEIVREGIEHTIEWSELGFELSGSYANGVEAADAVALARPDVVITDICMPFCDGLDLTEHISERYPEMKVILLSGFDEFEYAQRAIRLGAYDYVLKPITADELRSLLHQVREELDREAESTAQLAEISRELSDSRDARIRVLTEELLKSSVNGDPGPGAASFGRGLEELGLAVPTGSSVVLVVDLDNQPQAPYRGDHQTLTALIRQVVGPDERVAFVFEDHRARSAVVLSGSSQHEAAAAARSVAEVARAAVV
ncbi:MAG TPA: response regulator, partial [Spirochaetia bacterium]|nr:response regulator [Spirochaetia bacterium]